MTECQACFERERFNAEHCAEHCDCIECEPRRLKARITDLESQLAAAREEQVERIAYCAELQRVTHDLVSSVLRSDAAASRRDAEEIAGILACSTSNCDLFAARRSGGMIVCDLCRAGMNAILEVEAKS